MSIFLAIEKKNESYLTRNAYSELYNSTNRTEQPFHKANNLNMAYVAAINV